MSKLDAYAVFGNPIGHSLSPFIHQQFAAQTGQSISYRTILTPTTQFELAVQHFVREGGKGANVTLPFKVQAFELCQQLSERARHAGAVNTLSINQGQLVGDNTDGAGLVWDIQRQIGSIAGSNVLLIGAGGAARGAIGSMLQAQVAHISIANRTLSKAQTLVDELGDQRLSARSLQQANAPAPDIIINSTSSSLSNELPDISPTVFQRASLSYDMFYQPQPTVFMRWSTEQNAAQLVSDGLGMLVAQAAESFYLWRKTRPDTGATLATVRDRLNNHF